MGHRREVFRPKSKKKIRSQIQYALTENKFSYAARIAAFEYSSRPIADDFTISILATAEAITLGREVEWKRSTEDLVSAGISIAERKLDSRINRKRRSIVFESIARSVEKSRKKESARGE
jgi:hypothetical protein